MPLNFDPSKVDEGVELSRLDPGEYSFVVLSAAERKFKSGKTGLSVKLNILPGDGD